MTIHPMAQQADPGKKSASRHRIIGVLAVATILGLGAIAFASGHYVTDNKSQAPQTTGQSTPPTIVPIDEGAPSDR
jgi:flagellar basal body-associated protein FliL